MKLDVLQTSKKEHAGFYAATFTYVVLKGKTVSRCTVS